MNSFGFETFKALNLLVVKRFPLTHLEAIPMTLPFRATSLTLGPVSPINLFAITEETHSVMANSEFLGDL